MMTLKHVIHATQARVRPRGPTRRTIFIFLFIILKQLKSKRNQIKFRKIPENS